MGPASRNFKILKKMQQAGVSTVRLNFSHGSFQTHAQAAALIKKINKTTQRKIKILQDLEGYRIRIGRLKRKHFAIKKDSYFYLVKGKKQKNSKEIPFDYQGDLSLIKEGQLVYIDDGRIELRVEKVKGERLKVRVLRGEVIAERKGVNFPGASLEFDTWGEKDRKALEFGLSLDIDFVAQSFVRDAADILKIKDILAKTKHSPQVVAKIENRSAVANIDEIIDAADMIMIARGDMGVCLPVFMVPIIQKEIIAKCLRKKRPVIVATQMLESMRQNPLPLRAEVSDVANAILDGADLLMLSAETAVGKYPVETVDMMRKIIDFTRNSPYYKHYSKNR